MIGLAKKWISFLWLLYLVQIEWGSIRMRGDSSPMCFLTCNCRRSLQNIHHESWNPSLFSFSGSNLTFISLCVFLMCPSWWYFHSVFQDADRFIIEGGFIAMIKQFPNGQQGHIYPCKNMCFSCLKRQVWVRQECCVCWCDAFPVWNLYGERMDSLLFIVAWQVKSQVMSRRSRVRYC